MAGPTAPKRGPARQRSRREGTRKLGFNETRELAELPGRIDAWEMEVRKMHERMSDPHSYSDGTDVSALAARLEGVQADLAAADDRWAELEEQKEEAEANR